MHLRIALALCLAAWPVVGAAVGTPAGTDIVNQVLVGYEIDDERRTGVSNVASIRVAEVIDLNVAVQTPERLVSSGISAQPLYFTVSNIGNGAEAIELAPEPALTGDDFDPAVSAASIVLDADGDGSLSSADTVYAPGTNEPILLPQESIGVFVVADIPAGLADGQRGLAGLRANSVTATGTPGQVFDGLGDEGVDVVLGPGGGIAASQGEFLVGEINLSLTKVASVDSPQGDERAIPGATLTYTIQVAAVGTGNARETLFRDAIPDHTLFVPGSLRLNGAPLSDLADADAGEYVAAAPEVVVRLGDLSASDPAQVIEFSVNIQ